MGKLRSIIVLFLVCFLTSTVACEYCHNAISGQAHLQGLEHIPLPSPSAYSLWAPRLKFDHIDAATEVGHDFPAHLIPQTVDASWKKKLEQSHAAYLDLEQIYQFDRQAAELWKQLLACQNSGVSASEQARRAYAQGMDFCPNQDDQDDFWSERLSDFHLRLLTFLQTTFIKTPHYHGHSRIRPEVFSSREEYNGLPTVLAPLHPLLVQVLMEIFATYWHFPRHLKFQTFAATSPLDLLASIGKGIVWVLGRGEDHFGLYEGVSVQQRFETYLFSLFVPSFQKRAEEFPADLADQERARVLHNLVFLWAHLPIAECFHWGLWPALNGALVFSLSDDDLGGPIFGGQKFPLSIFRANYVLSCGLPPQRQWEKIEGSNQRRVKESGFFEGYHDYASWNGHSWPFEDNQRAVIKKIRQLADVYLNP